MMRDTAANQLHDFKNNALKKTESITTSSGNPVGIQDASMTVGPRGPILLQDTHFLNKLQTFHTERIPERVAYAKGCGGFGYFEVTHDISKYCAASLFSEVKRRTPIAVRFSTFSGESGSNETVRDSKGFAVKFYTEDGIFDIVGQNCPVFSIRDPLLFPSLVHVVKRNPQTHLRDADMYWDFMSQCPETIHYMCMIFGDRGIPDGYRHMNGYSVHAYKLVNDKTEGVFAKFHFRTDQGVQNLDDERALCLACRDPDYCTRDLFNSIRNGNYPSWTLYVQLLTQQQAKNLNFDAFDPTKIWPYTEAPLIPVGKIILDRNPANYFAEIEQMAFSPANMVPGIEASPDKILQGRLFAYGDSQRYRLGTNYLQIPVNCPFRVPVKNFQRDGQMTVTDNQGGAPNYYPNTYSGPEPCLRARTLSTCCPISGDIYRHSASAAEDNFSQATDFWVLVLDDCARKRLVQSLATNLSKASQVVQERVARLFTMVHADFGRLLTEALNTENFEYC
ncbi:catalase-like [Glossina fuscipes]|uniref:Catalase-like n=1 Tax=Glossina fuscipes TaxID=7396 RepID=A0A9C6E3Z3_9MUSC|nr:catalase-like [Glossina fuscipes]